MATFWERLGGWKRETLEELRKHWWWVIIVAPVGGFVWALVFARIVDATNRYIDSHVTLAAIRTALHAIVSLLSGHPFVVMLEAIVLVFLLIVAHAYWVSSKTSDATEQPDVALVWDWTEEGKKVVESWRGGKSIIVHNRSGHYVYNSRLDPIPLPNPMMFDAITEIAPTSEQPAVGRWNVGSESRSTATDGYNHYIVANSEEVDEKGWTKKKAHNRGISSTFMEIPMAVTFESQNTTWKIEFDWHYDPADDDSYFIRKHGYKVSGHPAT